MSRTLTPAAAVLLLLIALGGATAYAQSTDQPGASDPADPESAGPDATGDPAADEPADGERPGQRRFVTGGPDGESLEIAAGPGSILGQDELLLKGYVDIRYRDLRIQADFVRYVPSTKEAYAEGNVILDQGSTRITAKSLVYNLETDTGTFTDARGVADPNIYFSARQIDKIGPNELVLHDARFTACTQPIPYWSFKIGRGLLRLGEYAYLHDMSFRIGRVPVFYTPYLVWPIKTDRASGLLFPQFGFSDRSGTVISQAFYWAMRRNMDATVYFDYLSKAGYGTGLEYRYVPSERGAGHFSGYYIRDQIAEEEQEEGVPVNRWVINYEHRQDFGPDWRFVANANFISDFDYYQDFVRDLRLSSNPQAVSDLFLTRNWGFYSLNLRGERREQLVNVAIEPVGIGDDFLTTEEQTIVRWIRPEAELRSRRQRLGKAPLFLSLESSAAFLGKGDVDADYGRLDAYPTLSSQVSPVPWLDIDASVGYRTTYYTKSQRGDLGCDNIPGTGDAGEGNGRFDDREIDVAGVCNTGTGLCTAGLIGMACTVNADCETSGVFDTDDDIGCDGDPVASDFGQGNLIKDREEFVIFNDPLNRDFYQAGLTVIGPKVSRVFLRPESKYSPRYKHTMEPTLRYNYQSPVEDTTNVIQFDEIDRVGASVFRNRLTYAFVTRLFAKRPSGGATSAGRPSTAGVDFIGGSSDPLAGIEEQLIREMEREDAERRDAETDDGTAPAPAPVEPQLSTVEIASLEISQDYSFLAPLSRSFALSKERQVSPIRGTLRINPSLNASVDVRTTFDVLFNEIREASLSANLRNSGRGFLSVTWSLVRDLEGKALLVQLGGGSSPFDRNQIGFNGETNLFGSRLLLGMQLNYELGDVLPGEPRLRDQSYKLGYNTQCCGFQFEYLDRNYSGSDQREIRFLLNLRGVGNVVDLHSTMGSGGF